MQKLPPGKNKANKKKNTRKVAAAASPTRKIVQEKKPEAKMIDHEIPGN